MATRRRKAVNGSKRSSLNARKKKFTEEQRERDRELHGVNSHHEKEAKGERHPLQRQLQRQHSSDSTSTTDSTSSSSYASSPSSSLLLAYLWTYGPYGISGTLVYRGMWELQGVCLEYVFPEHPVMCALASIAVALVCSVLLLAFPRGLRKHEWLVTILMIIVTIFYLRGVWDFWDWVVFPEYPLCQTLLGFIPGVFVLWRMEELRWGLVGAPVILVDDSNTKDKTNLPLIRLYYPPWSKEWLEGEDGFKLD